MPAKCSLVQKNRAIIKTLSSLTLNLGKTDRSVSKSECSWICAGQDVLGNSWRLLSNIFICGMESAERCLIERGKQAEEELERPWTTNIHENIWRRLRRENAPRLRLYCTPALHVMCLHFFLTGLALVVIPAHLHSDSVFMFPLHVVDVPRHSGHGVDGLLDNVIALLIWVKVLCYFL